MKKKFLFLTMAAMIFVGCSNEDAVEEPALPITKDGTAYIAVKIASVPGTRGTDEGFEYGSANEHTVTSADFYFYDAEGGYVAKANVWKNGSANTVDPDANIEYMGENVVMLKGLTEKNFPKYVVTVLNQPSSGFVPGKTLKEMEETLVNSVQNGNNFVMTTSSYKHETNKTAEGQPLYFATEVTEDNFVKDPTGDVTTPPVVIYVERLAAKVNLSTSLTPVTGEENTYEIKVTVGGSDNAEDNDDNIGAETVRIRFDGWGLNATAKQSYIVKNINCDWVLGSFAWNEHDANIKNFRSLWGMGTAYNQPYSKETYNKLLNYNSWNQLKAVGIGNDAYCAENTNTADILEDHLNAASTSVVIAATVLCKNSDGTWGEGDMVRSNGLLYKTDAFKQHAMNNLSALGLLNYYTKVETEAGTVYNQIDGSYVDIVKVDGETVKLQLNESAKSITWYKKDAGAEDGYSETTLDVTALQTELDKYTGNGFKGGKMYYSIPIEHLYNSENLEEGNYGVVRNHYYKLNVNKLEHLGRGVWDPDSEIIPGDDPEFYQVGVEINILSWRVVDQSVNL